MSTPTPPPPARVYTRQHLLELVESARALNTFLEYFLGEVPDEPENPLPSIIAFLTDTIAVLDRVNTTGRSYSRENLCATFDTLKPRPGTRDPQ